MASADDEVRRYIERRRRLKTEMAENLRRNLQALSVYLPSVAARFSAYKVQRPFELVPMENGQANLFRPDSGDFLYVTDNPREFAGRLTEERLKDLHIRIPHYNRYNGPFDKLHLRYSHVCLDISSEYGEVSLSTDGSEPWPCCMVFGVGLGYQLEYLIAKFDILNLQIIEPDSDLFYASLQTCRWDRILEYFSDPKRHLQVITGVDSKQAANLAVDFYYQHGLVLRECAVWFMHYKSELLSATAHEVLQTTTVVAHMPGFIDDMLEGLSNCCRAIQAGAGFVRKGARVPEAFADVPFFIVGNGPSLDQDLDFIRVNRGKAMIAACGSAIESLYNAGIKPDFYVCTERTLDPLQVLTLIGDREHFRGIVLIGAEVVHPWILEYFDVSALFLKEGESGESLLRDGLDQNNLQSLGFMNPLVGNLALSAALTLGFRNICLFGLDCAKKSTAEPLHSGSSTHYKKPLSEALESFQGFNYLVKGNFGGEVVVNQVFWKSLKILSAALSVRQGGVSCVNCSDGALIEGAEPIKSRDLDFSALPEIDRESCVRIMLEEMTTKVKITAEEFRNALNPEAFSACLRQLRTFFLQQSEEPSQVIASYQNAVLALSSLIRNRDNAFIAEMILAEIQYFFGFVMSALYHAGSMSERLEDARLMTEQLLFCLEDAERVYRMIPGYVQGEHVTLMHGKVGYDHPYFQAPAMANLPVFYTRN